MALADHTFRLCLPRDMGAARITAKLDVEHGTIVEIGGQARCPLTALPERTQRQIRNHALSGVRG